jgi:predicted transcriptional regulator
VASDATVSKAPGNPPIAQQLILRRGRTEIMASLLEAAKEAKSRTHLMYASELDSRGLKKYLSFLISRNFVELQNRSTGRYRITAKGLEFLETHRKLASLQSV